MRYHFFTPVQIMFLCGMLNLSLVHAFATSPSTSTRSVNKSQCAFYRNHGFGHDLDRKSRVSIHLPESVMHARSIDDEVDDDDDDDDSDVEVVGSSGRIGSYLLRSLMTSSPSSSSSSPSPRIVVADVPRNVDGQGPGSFSPRGCPIFVSIPATQISDVISKTPSDRKNDLIFVTNGIPSDYLAFHPVRVGKDQDEDLDLDDVLDPNQITTCVPHFAVLSVGDDPIPNISTSCPPTIIHGRHAHILSNLLTNYGVKTEIVSSIRHVDAAAIRKLLWVSIMWLLCHDDAHSYGDDGDNDEEENNECTYKYAYPINVNQVHESKQHLLRTLVEELIPAANLLLKRFHSLDNEESTSSTMIEIGIGSVDEVVEYMQHYSFSMPNAIPNKQLAIDEFGKRNGLLLDTNGEHEHEHEHDNTSQPNHLDLILRVVGYIP